MNKGKYDDMLNMPHHVSVRHPQMPLQDRAAQFAPYAALTGFEEAIRERVMLDEEAPARKAEKEPIPGNEWEEYPEP